MSEPRKTAEASEAFDKLIQVIRTLRSEDGCPWDREQTPQSFHPYILEEYHEMVQAINGGDTAEIIDEIGDLLFLVTLVAYMFEQQGITSLAEVLEGVTRKMIRRHPHVFGNTLVRDSDDVVDNWAKIKASEENIKKRESLMDGIPRSLPALNRAQKVANRAAKVGFDWTGPEDVLFKVEEEFNELKEAASSGSDRKIREELGDLLFVIVNAARHLGIHGETALNETSDKFERRFRHIEAGLKSQGKSLEEANLREMDDLWDQAKSLEKE